MKKYGIPFLIIIVASFLMSLIRKHLYVQGLETFLTVLTIVLAFVFGASLNDHRSTRGDTWLKKMIIMFLFVLVALIYFGVINVTFINHAFSFLGFTNIIYYFLFIWFGYLFFC